MVFPVELSIRIEDWGNIGVIGVVSDRKMRQVIELSKVRSYASDRMEKLTPMVNGDRLLHEGRGVATVVLAAVEVAEEE